MPKMDVPQEIVDGDFIEKPQNPGYDDGRCALCKKDGLTEDARCFGCGYLVCEDCDERGPWGSHFVTEHQEEL